MLQQEYNLYKINIGDQLTCIANTPCGTLKAGDTCVALSDMFSQGYGPEISVDIGDGKSRTIQVMYLIERAKLRELKLNEIL